MKNYIFLLFVTGKYDYVLLITLAIIIVPVIIILKHKYRLWKVANDKSKTAEDKMYKKYIDYYWDNIEKEKELDDAVAGKDHDLQLALSEAEELEKELERFKVLIMEYLVDEREWNSINIKEFYDLKRKLLKGGHSFLIQRFEIFEESLKKKNESIKNKNNDVLNRKNSNKLINFFWLNIKSERGRRWIPLTWLMFFMVLLVAFDPFGSVDDFSESIEWLFGSLFGMVFCYLMASILKD